MEHARSESVAGDFGYAIGKRLCEVVLDEGCDDEEPGSASATVSSVWAGVRRLVAEVFGKSVFRMATTLPQDILAVALAARGIVDFGLPQDSDPLAMLRALRPLGTNECPLDLPAFRAELDAVMMEEHDENPAVVHAGTTTSADAAHNATILLSNSRAHHALYNTMQSIVDIYAV